MENPGEIRHHQTDEFLKHMDEEISAPPPDIESCLSRAVERGFMSEDEKQMYLNLYIGAFQKCKEIYHE